MDSSPVPAKKDNKYTNPSGLASITVVVTSGLVFGTLLQFIGTYIYYYIISQDCSMYLSEPSCTSLINADCQWIDSSCKFPDYQTLECGNFTNSDDCGNGGSCFYDYGDEVCLHSAGWSPLQIGIFAASPIFGGVFSGLVVEVLLKRWQWVSVAKLVGITMLVSGVLMTLGHNYNSYALIIVSRILHGLVGFMTTSIGILYSIRRRPDISATLSPIMQVFICVGFVLGATVGLVLDPKPKGTDGDLRMNARVQGSILLATYLLGAAYLLIGLIVEEPPALHTPEDDEQSDQVVEEEETFTNWQVAKFYLKGACVGLAIHSTGVGVYVGFGPAIVGEAGMDAMLGSFLIAAAQLLGSFVGFIPMKLKFAPRRILIAGMALCSVACFICFIGVFPGIVAEGDGTVAVTMLGLMFYCLVFNATVGPQSWVMMAIVFPKKHMQFGTGTAVACTAFGNLMVNLLFPVAVDGISGGPSGNQSYGYGSMFLIFAVLSIIFFFLITCFVDVYQTPAQRAAAARAEQEAVVSAGEPIIAEEEEVAADKEMTGNKQDNDPTEDNGRV